VGHGRLAARPAETHGFVGYLEHVIILSERKGKYYNFLNETENKYASLSTRHQSIPVAGGHKGRAQGD
jgi:hypothetical protein